MAYQSHNSQFGGDSDTQGKLAKLGLPADMSGTRFLDLGCNEGFFCNVAQRRGAALVTGVDKDQTAISKAKQLYPNIDFRCEDWRVFQDSEFDIVLLSSALHYSNDPFRLLLKISDLMSQNGLFVIEAGAIDDRGSNLQGMRIGRSIDSCVFPTVSAFEKMLLRSGLIPRMIGRSVMQSGDPVERWVWHCTKARAHVVLVTGYSGSGKTTLVNSIQGSIPIDAISTDSLLGHLFKHDLQKFLSNFNESLSADIQEISKKLELRNPSSPWENLDFVSHELIRRGRSSDLVELILSQLSFITSQTAFVEGFLLTFSEVYFPLVEKLEEMGLLVSQMRAGVGFNFSKFQQDHAAD